MEVREALLRAAAELVTERGIDEIPVRMVAQRAGVTPAMVTYYFESKEGLWDALIVSGMEDLRGSLTPPLKGAGTPDLALVLEEVMSTLHTRPWIPMLVLRSLWGAPKQRSAVAMDQAPTNLSVLRALLTRGAVGGRRLRRDVPLEALMVVVLSSMTFPVLAKPVLERALGRPFDSALRKQLARTVVTLITEAEHLP